MNWLEHEYLVPVIIGNDREAVRVAKAINRATHIDAHLFAESFSFWQKLSYNCHKVDPMREEFLLDSLLNFANNHEDYNYLVIIVRECNMEFIKKYSEEIESAFVTVDVKELLN
jgi:predicted ATP-grasp superfamily ATP-dependent carboligase